MKLEQFSKTYAGRTVLRFPGYCLEPGKIYSVIGANGSGKSTLAKILAGAEQSDERAAPSDAASTGYMPQKSYAFRMSVAANLRMAGQDRDRAGQLMDALKIRHLETCRADRLSGGETARMALARLMMRSFSLVVLDEPTAAMDLESTLLAERLIKAYVRETGCALILVTHNLRQARRMSDETLFFCEGTLIESGACERLLTNPACAETKRFLEFCGA